MKEILKGKLEGAVEALPWESGKPPKFRIRGRQFTWLGDPAALERGGAAKKAVDMRRRRVFCTMVACPRSRDSLLSSAG